MQLSCAVAFCGCMETSKEGNFFGHFSAADINYYFMSTACLPDLFPRDFGTLKSASDTSKYAGLADEKKAGHSHALQKSLLKKKFKKELEQPVCQTCRTN